MAQSGAYKQYSRGIRNLILEESFAGGMRSDAVPLADGTFKTLVNFQIQENGDRLVPRKGKVVDNEIVFEAQPYAVYTTDLHSKELICSINNIYDSDEVNIGTLFSSFPLRTYSELPNKTYLNIFIGAHAGTTGYKGTDIENTTNSVGDEIGLLHEHSGELYSVFCRNNTLRKLDSITQSTNISLTELYANHTAFLSYTSLIGRKIIEDDITKYGIKVYNNLDCFKLKPKLLLDGFGNHITAINKFCDATPPTGVTYINPSDWANKKVISEITIDANNKLVTKPIKPKELDPSYATNYGFNMLSDTPYEFANKNTGAQGAFQLTGIMLYKDEACTEVATSYNVNETIYIKRFYNYPGGGQIIILDGRLAEDHVAYLLRLEVNYGAGDTWQILEQIGLNTNEELDEAYFAESFNVIPFKVPAEDFILRASIFDTTACFPLVKVTNDDYHSTVRALGEYYPENMESHATEYPPGSGALVYDNTATEFFCMSQSLTSCSGGERSEKDYGSTKGITNPNYDLATAQGMLAWKRRIVLWGVEGAPDAIFMSDPDRINYYPYPNGVEVYDNNILNVIPFMDSLLVLTQDKIYKTILNDDGTFKTDTVAADVNISYDDAFTAVAVKNMLFYKSGNYYYMLVPSSKALTFGELNVAPISNPINYFLDHFDVELKKVLINMYAEDLNYPEVEDITLVPDLYDVYVAGNEICVAHNFKMLYADEEYSIDFVLKYNSVLRTWSADLFNNESGYIQLALKNIAGTPRYATFYSVIEDDQKKSYMRMLTESNDGIKDDFDTSVKLTTKQFLDTGYRALSVGNKKRMREIQFKINDKLAVPLEFKTGFILDNERRTNIGSYILTPNDDVLTIVPNRKVLDTYGQIVYNDDEEPILNDNVFSLDDSNLTTYDTVTVRWKISGKGYLPRLTMLSENNKSYELIGLGWVARLMNAR